MDRARQKSRVCLDWSFSWARLPAPCGLLTGADWGHLGRSGSDGPVGECPPRCRHVGHALLLQPNPARTHSKDIIARQEQLFEGTQTHARRFFLVFKSGSSSSFYGFLPDGFKTKATVQVRWITDASAPCPLS
ncbi:hypothetical protein SKAU_G00134820 [Synaphobranchus kaupii]|uniref:Uncharacterized protein n=1 Tax=Synaphobranchus kaupii TaxID=118154 RepID=A0A9Q1FRQ9_SYNKA|nr:hypothetical protein SKAU_G00134820 [Synaphobranchus kaupii]